MNMEQKFYLLATLIEMQDSVSDGHALYRSLDDAMKAFEPVTYTHLTLPTT